MAGTGCAIVVLLGLSAGAGHGHEERLSAGRIETIEPAKQLLVVDDGGQRRRLEVNPETEVMACRAATGLGALSAGATVRVKYRERAGSVSEVSSVFVLGSRR
jgi:hypothetical protein